jgi:hypothetical protein
MKEVKKSKFVRYAEKMTKLGFLSYRVWVHKDDYDTVKTYCEQLRNKRMKHEKNQ